MTEKGFLRNMIMDGEADSGIPVLASSDLTSCVSGQLTLFTQFTIKM